MKPPRVTVLMSVHNGGRWLRAATESILAQTFRDFEFLILDDASTDQSAALIEGIHDPRIHLIRLPENIGLTRCLNVGLQKARGEIIARQDSDDLSYPDRLTKQIAFLDAHPKVAVVGSQARLIDAEDHSRGQRDLPLDAASVRWLSLFDNPIIHTAATFRAAVARDEFNGYDETFPCCQDYDLWTRVMERHEVCNLKERLVEVREHGGSISATRRDEARIMVDRVVRRLAPDFDEQALALLGAYRRHLLPDEVDAFHHLLARWDAAFAARFPGTDAAHARAGVLARVGYNLLTRDRLLALQELLAAVRTSPGIAASIPWLRVLALLIFGDKVRDLVAQRRAATPTR